LRRKNGWSRRRRKSRRAGAAAAALAGSLIPAAGRVKKVVEGRAVAAARAKAEGSPVVVKVVVREAETSDHAFYVSASCD
jgi:hypothetical protein